MKADAEILQKSQILSILFSDYNLMVNDVMTQRSAEITKEFEKGSNEDMGDKWAVYRSQA